MVKDTTGNRTRKRSRKDAITSCGEEDLRSRCRKRELILVRATDAVRSVRRSKTGNGQGSILRVRR